jgi:hypothetical protein
VTDGLTFTVGQITWTTSTGGFIVTTTEEAQIQSASITSSLAMAPTTPATSPTTPATRRLLPCYKGRQIDNTDLLEAIDRVDLKLSESLALVNSIRDQSTEQVATHHNRSTRPDRARHLAWFDTDLVVTATPKGRTVRLCPVSATGLRLSEHQIPKEDRRVSPHSLANTASQHAYHIPHLFMDPTEQDHVLDLCVLDVPRPLLDNAVNMVQIRELREGSVHTATSST